MFGRWSREHGTQVHDREAPSRFIDQVYGGGTVGAVVPQAVQVVVQAVVELVVLMPSDPRDSAVRDGYGQRNDLLRTSDPPSAGRDTSRATHPRATPRTSARGVSGTGGQPETPR